MRGPVTVLLLAVMALAGGCDSDKHRQTLPRRDAYPRLEAYPAEYVRAEVPIGFDVNASAQTKTERHADGSYWLTSSYPRYGATMYCTFVPVESKKEVGAVVDNRLERMRLNVGEAPVRTEQYSGDNYSFTLVSTRTPSATPLQFLVYPSRGKGWVASGTVFFPGIRPGSSLDSIRPAIDALENDIRHSIYRLTNE